MLEQIYYMYMFQSFLLQATTNILLVKIIVQDLSKLFSQLTDLEHNTTIQSQEDESTFAFIT